MLDLVAKEKDRKLAEERKEKERLRRLQYEHMTAHGYVLSPSGVYWISSQRV